jgi:hypothetical protein
MVGITINFTGSRNRPGAQDVLPLIEGKFAVPDSGTIVKHVAVRKLSENEQNHWSTRVDGHVTPQEPSESRSQRWQEGITRRQGVDHSSEAEAP